jgi:hypothetical protein
VAGRWFSQGCPVDEIKFVSELWQVDGFLRDIQLISELWQVDGFLRDVS